MLFGSLALAASATSAMAAQVCSPAGCVHGVGPSALLLEDKANDTYYIPGVYSGNINLDSRDRIAVNPALTSTTISTSPMPAAFKAVAFAGGPLSTTEKTVDEAWMSLLLPHGWYGRYSSGEVLWGAVPDRTQLSLSTSLEETMQIKSALCTPSCSVHGTCVPNQANTNGTCSCDAGWEGDACELCASGHYGSSCMACSDRCGKCDDGLDGSGACTAPLVADCNCGHGSCLPSGDCACSSGYVSIDDGTGGKQCEFCAVGYYANDDGSCKPCPTGCKTCALNKDSQGLVVDCLQCAGSSEAVPSAEGVRCRSAVTCAQGSFWNRSAGSCQNCASSCLDCHGPSPNKCSSCRGQQAVLKGECVMYHESTGQCETRGEGGPMIFTGGDSSQCEPCPVSCKDCQVVDGRRVCLACHDGYLLSSGTCVKSCPEGQFMVANRTSGTCNSCDPSCQSCMGDSKHCKKCSSGLAHEGACVSQCPIGTLEHEGRCQKCHPDCGTCSSAGMANTCTSCPPTRPILQYGRCIEYCPKGAFIAPDSRSQGANVNSTTCKKCHASCETCISGDACTTCYDNFLLVQGQCQPANCTGPFASGLGVCLSALVTTQSKGSQAKSTRYLPLLLLLALPIGLAVVWYIRREHRKTRDATAEFGRQLDEVDIDRRVERLAREEKSLDVAASQPAPQLHQHDIMKASLDHDTRGHAPTPPPPYEQGNCGPPPNTRATTDAGANSSSSVSSDSDDEFTSIPLSPGGLRPPPRRVSNPWANTNGQRNGEGWV